jgi:hypothetical protein
MALARTIPGVVAEALAPLRAVVVAAVADAGEEG